MDAASRNRGGESRRYCNCGLSKQSLEATGMRGVEALQGITELKKTKYLLSKSSKLLGE